MNEKLMLWISIGVLITIVTIIALMGLFSFSLFLIMVLFSSLYFARIFYIRYGHKEQEKQQQEFFGRIRKFDWCWERVNVILASMPGGQGIRWNRGRDVSSSLKSINNGVSHKPFRAFLAYLERENTRIIIIYDVDEDDIVEVNQNLREEHYSDLFFGFSPFTSGGSSRFGGDYDGLGGEFGNRYQRPNNGGFNINVGNGSNPQRYDNDLVPNEDDVNKAFDKMDKK